MKNEKQTTWDRNPLTPVHIPLFELLKAGTASHERGVIKGYFDIKPNVYFAAGKKSKKRISK